MISPVQNPPWATRVLSESWETIAAHVKPAWFPVIDPVGAARGRMSAEIHEYGCGAYGCVFPTYDPAVVLKITADSTEAEFAASLAPTIEAPICVRYHAVMKLAGTFKDATRRSTLYLLWRESADHVGDEKALGEQASVLINQQHASAQSVYEAITHHEDPDLILEYIDHWLSACERMAQSKKIASLGLGMVQTYRESRIVFGDIHAGNVGLVKRGDKQLWVITDPGHVAVIDADMASRPKRATGPRR